MKRERGDLSKSKTQKSNLMLKPAHEISYLPVIILSSSAYSWSFKMMGEWLTILDVMPIAISLSDRSVGTLLPGWLTDKQL